MNEFQTDEAPRAGGLAQATPTVPQPAPAVPVEDNQPSEYELAKINLDKQRQEILNTQKKLLESLEARVAGPQDMLWGLAQAFAAPTRTGSFGESFGHATQAMGQHVAQQKQQMSDVAKMRLDLQMQELAMREKDVERLKKEKAFDLIGSALSISPKQASESSGGILDAKQSEKLIQIYPQVAKFDKDAAAALKNSFEMTSNLRKEVQEDIKLGMTYVDLRGKYPAAIMSFFPKELVDRFQSTKIGYQPIDQQQTSAPSSSVKPSLQIPADTQAERDRYAEVIKQREQTGAGIPTNKIVQDQKAAPQQPSSAVDVENSQLSIVDQAKLIAERAAKRDEEFKPQRANIISWDPGTLDRSNSDLHDLAQIANKHPKIFNALGGNGYFEALAKAVNDPGVQAGKFGAFSLPTSDFVRNIKLSREEKVALARVQQILSNQFFLNAKDNKSILGPQISNSDVMLLRAPLASVENPAPFIIYWAQQNTLLNNQRKDIHKSFLNYEQKIGSGAPLGAFFNPQGPLYSILDFYSKDYDALNKRQPYYRAK